LAFDVLTSCFGVLEMSHVKIQSYFATPLSHTCFSESTGPDDKVRSSTADEAQHVVGRLQVMPEPHILVIEDIIRPVHTPEHLQAEPNPSPAGFSACRQDTHA